MIGLRCWTRSSEGPRLALDESKQEISGMVWGAYALPETLDTVKPVRDSHPNRFWLLSLEQLA